MESHWVEKLFPPAYSSQDSGEPLPNSLLKKFNTRERHDLNERLRAAANISVDDQIANTDRDREDSKLFTDTMTIWTDRELEILRESTKKIHDENSRLKLQLQVMQSESKEMKNRLEKVSKQLEKSETVSATAMKANARLSIRVVSLEHELTSCQGENTTLKKHLDTTNMERYVLKKKLTELNNKCAELKLNNRRLLLEIKESRVAREDEKQSIVDHLTSSSDKKIMDLQKQLDDLSGDLLRERNIHSVNKEALEQLRLHFSSMQPHGKVGGELEFMT